MTDEKSKKQEVKEKPANPELLKEVLNENELNGIAGGVVDNGTITPILPNPG